MDPYGGFLSHRGTPSSHPFLVGIFRYKPSILGYHHLWKPAYEELKRFKLEGNPKTLSAELKIWNIGQSWIPSGKLFQFAIENGH